MNKLGDLCCFLSLSFYYHFDFPLPLHLFTFAHVDWIESEVIFEQQDNVSWKNHLWLVVSWSTNKLQNDHRAEYKSLRNVTGIHGTNSLKSILHLYIFDTKTKCKSYYCFDPAWYNSLQKVKGKFGMGRVQE